MNSRNLCFPDAFQPFLIFLLSPVPDHDDVAVGIFHDNFTAEHVFRIADFRTLKAAGEQVLAKRGKVRCVHVEDESLLGRINRVFGAEEHECSTFAVKARPSEGLAAVGVDDGEAERFVKADGALDVRYVEERSGVGSFRRHGEGLYETGVRVSTFAWPQTGRSGARELHK